MFVLSGGDLRNPLDEPLSEGVTTNAQQLYPDSLMRFTRGLEYISPPEETLESRGGDCDDQAILAASMLEAVGEEVGLVLCGNGSEYHLFPIVKKGVDGQDQSLKTKLTWLYTQDRTIVPNYGTVSFTVSENELWWPVDSTARTIGDIDGLLEEGFIINNGNGWDFFDVSYHFRDKNDRSIEFG